MIERFDGERLADKLARKRRITVEELLPIVSQLLKALEYIHARGIVARCVDPSHLLLGNDGTHANIVRAVGFGIGELLQNSDPPEEQELVGSTAYTAPEQLRGESVDARADVYAVGRLMVALLQGQTSPADVPLSQRSSTKRFHVPPGCEAIPEPLLHFIESCLHPDPQERPAHGAALVERLIDAVPSASMLRLPRITGSHVAVGRRSPSRSSPKMETAAVATTPIQVETPATPTPAPPTPPPRRSAVAPMLGVAALCAAAIGIAWWLLVPSVSETLVETPTASLPPAAAPSSADDEPPSPEANVEVGAVVHGPVGDDAAPSAPPSEPSAIVPADADAPPPPSNTLVRIDSRPRGVLYIDGAERGKTPFEGTLAAGTHYVEVVGPQGERWRETLEVEGGGRQSLVLTAPDTAEPAAPRRAKKSAPKRAGTPTRPTAPASRAPRPAADPPPPKEDPFLPPSKRKANKDTHLLPGGADR